MGTRTPPKIGVACLAVVALSACQPESNRVCVATSLQWSNPSGKMQDKIVNTVALEGPEIRWNGAPIDEATLTAYLDQISGKADQLFLVLDRAGASCDRGEQIRELIEAHYPCNDGRCGVGHVQDFVAPIY